MFRLLFWLWRNGDGLVVVLDRELSKIEERNRGWTMWGHLDWHCEHAGLARVFEEGKRFEIDDYVYALPFVVRRRYQLPDEDGFIGEVEFVGVVKAPTPSEYRAMRDAMHHSMYRILSSRVKGGRKRTIEVCSRHATQTGDEPCD